MPDIGSGSAAETKRPMPMILAAEADAKSMDEWLRGSGVGGGGGRAGKTVVANVATAHKLRHAAGMGRRRRASKLVCCGRGDSSKVTRTIFNLLDMDGDNKVSWTEFCLFVKHSYEYFPALVQSFGQRDDHNREDQRHSEVSRFRRMVLQAVMGSAINQAELLVWERLQDDVLEALFEGSRKFEGKGFVAKARRVFRRFDTNDSGAISFTEFEDSLHMLGFFDFNIEARNNNVRPGVAVAVS